MLPSICNIQSTTNPEQATHSTPCFHSKNTKPQKLKPHLQSLLRLTLIALVTEYYVEVQRIQKIFTGNDVAKFNPLKLESSDHVE